MKTNYQQTRVIEWGTPFSPCLLVLLLLLSSCLLQKGNSVNSRTTKANNGRISNDPNTVNVGYGRILHANPIVLSGDPYLRDGYDFGKLLSHEQDFITYNSILESGCGPSNLSSAWRYGCFKV